jgi:hypothetical protein
MLVVNIANIYTIKYQSVKKMGQVARKISIALAKNAKSEP